MLYRTSKFVAVLAASAESIRVERDPDGIFGPIPGDVVQVIAGEGTSIQTGSEASPVTDGQVKDNVEAAYETEEEIGYLAGYFSRLIRGLQGTGGSVRAVNNWHVPEQCRGINPACCMPEFEQNAACQEWHPRCCHYV